MTPRPRLLSLLAGGLFLAATTVSAVSVQDPVSAQDIDGPLEERPSAVTEEERLHTASEGPFRVSTLWRSERSLDRHAREGLRIVLAVDAVGLRRAARPDEGHPQEFLLSESPMALFKQSRLEKEPGVKERMPMMANEVFRWGPAPAVAVAPRIHDRTLFGTGLPPVTKRVLAMVAARRAVGLTSDLGRKLERDERILLEGRADAWAQAGLERAGFARAADEEPFTSNGIVHLRRDLAGVPVERRGAKLVDIAGSSATNLMRWQGDMPFAGSGGRTAGALLATAEVSETATMAERATAALEALDALSPRWTLEGGAVATHPYGWQAVATRKLDALVLSAEPLDGGPFTLRTKLTVYSNDLKTAGQGDIVFGEQDGDRLLLACNSDRGLYLFRRAGRDAEYEMLAELPGAKVPIAREVAIEIRFDGEVLQIVVGDAKMVPVRIAGRTLAGSWGFGAHAGSTAMFREFELKR